jgi:sugar phosphate isomerase/epimerase
MPRPAIQLYTLRNVDRPFTDLLELVAEAGFDGVEFAGRVTEADPDAVVETLAETGLDVAGAHVGIEALEDDFEETVAVYDTFGVEHVVVPWLDAEHFASREAVAAAADRLSAVESRLDDRAKTLHYHNHDHEFVDLNGQTGFDAFVEATTCGIELDLGWALSAGEDPAAFLRSLGPRARLVHCKDAALDADADASAPLGAGDLDLDSIGAAVTDVDPEWLIYEYEGADPLATLERSATRTRALCRSG